MNWIVRAISVVLVAFSSGFASAASLTTEEAAHHVGETATVCGGVASANYASHSKGQPTFLNLDKAYPNQTFTAVIWESDRSKFGTPESALLGKQVCATGVIQLFRGRPEVVLHDPSQLIQK
jgi:DNA/RNA endonuclease YhcR with UshA esterase domain